MARSSAVWIVRFTVGGSHRSGHCHVTKKPSCDVIYHMKCLDPFCQEVYRMGVRVYLDQFLKF